eukprot:gnl/TRDRNA2_/TRDRNA2_200856_c0_seq1.p1 gnl/TRDRNA2_/TRDRNA2_200856_c0~~gnl/TRDRNA2_/TRDRNA2_200856_c0_seq1.p1  ORF type:complete len:219 (-),score=11.40 gnl/TRDRNA2_/TRDRNA2_200856_c0_seq1:134-790(-)
MARRASSWFRNRHESEIIEFDSKFYRHLVEKETSGMPSIMDVMYPKPGVQQVKSARQQNYIGITTCTQDDLSLPWEGPPSARGGKPKGTWRPPFVVFAESLGAARGRAGVSSWRHNVHKPRGRQVDVRWCSSTTFDSPVVPESTAFVATRCSKESPAQAFTEEAAAPARKHKSRRSRPDTPYMSRPDTPSAASPPMKGARSNVVESLGFCSIYHPYIF